MNVTPEPIISTLDYTESDKIIRIAVKGEKVIDFSMSKNWTIREVVITRDRNKMFVTVERSEDENV